MQWTDEGEFSQQLVIFCDVLLLNVCYKRLYMKHLHLTEFV